MLAVADAQTLFGDGANPLPKTFGVGFIDWLDRLSWLIKVELVVDIGQIRAGLLDNAFRERRKLCSG